MKRRNLLHFSKDIATGTQHEHDKSSLQFNTGNA
jgi:hypothetical protein